MGLDTQKGFCSVCKQVLSGKVMVIKWGTVDPWASEGWAHIKLQARPTNYYCENCAKSLGF